MTTNPVTKKQVAPMTVDALEKLMNKKFGAGTLRRASDASLEIQRIPCGILSLDQLLGGGFARGRHFEIYGGYNVGKTATAYKLIANIQKMGGRAAFLDIEGTFDPKFASSLEVDLEELGWPEFDSGEQAVDIMIALIRSELYDVIVLDSIAALAPQAELDSETGGGYGTAQAKLMSKALRNLTAALIAVERKPVLLYINQTREAIGVMFGNKSITSGGKAMGFYAGTRIEMTRTESIKRPKKKRDHKGGKIKKEVVCGHRVLVRVEKDKTGGTKPYESSTFVFNYDIGDIDKAEDIIYCGLLTGIIKVSGNSWWIDGLKDDKQNGRKRFLSYLKDQDPEFLEDLLDMIRVAEKEEEESLEEEED